MQTVENIYFIHIRNLIQLFVCPCL